jgi:hypothetical protein
MGTISIKNAASPKSTIITPEYTWATRPSASTFGKGSAFFTDIGVNGSIGYSDGSRWDIPTRNTYSDGTVVFGGKTTYGTTFTTSGARKPVLTETTSLGMHVVGPLHTDATNDYTQFDLPVQPVPGLFPRSFSIKVYSPDWSKVDRIIFLLGTTAFAKYFTREFNPHYSTKFAPGMAGKAGWRTLSTSYADWTNTGSADFTTDLFSVIRIKLFGITGDVSPDVTFGEMRINCTDVPTISMCSDDGYSSFYTIAAPLLAARGLKASFAVIPDKVGSAARYVTWDQLRAWNAAGNNCVTHGCRNDVASLQVYSTMAERVADATWSRQQIIDNGCDVNGSTNFYVFPQGKVTVSDADLTDRTITDALINAGFTGGRGTTLPWTFINRYTRTDSQKMIMSCIGHTWSSGDQAGNITAIVAKIDDCATYGFSANLVFHEIVDPSTLDIHISTADFTTIINRIAYWVNQGKLSNVLINEQFDN